MKNKFADDITVGYVTKGGILYKNLESCKKSIVFLT